MKILLGIAIGIPLGLLGLYVVAQIWLWRNGWGP